MISPFLTIFTPLYNRRKFLPRLLESLADQTDHDFEWIVIDDGSSDNPNEFFNSLDIENILFEIKFYSVKNGGKHRAVNMGARMAKGKWFLILDSDDWLKPEAVAIIKDRVQLIMDNDSFAGICALRVTPDDKDIGSSCDYTTLDSTFFDYRFKHRIKGDRAEVVRTSIMKEYPFPEFKQEKFLGESILWNQISKKYLTRFTSDRFYICDYQPEGLTDTFTRQMENNPLGAMVNEKYIATYQDCPLAFRMISVLFYFRYFHLAKNKYGLSSIPRSLRPTLKMNIYRLFNPLTAIMLSMYRKLRKE